MSKREPTLRDRIEALRAEVAALVDEWAENECERHGRLIPKVALVRMVYRGQCDCVTALRLLDAAGNAIPPGKGS